MYNAPQIAPISTLARDQKTLVKKLKDGPVFLTQRGTEAAVMLSSQEWRGIVKRLEELESIRRQARLDRSNQAFREMLADPAQIVDQAEYEQMVSEAGLTQ